MAKRWSCVDACCSWSVTAPDLATVVPLAQAHIEDEHGSFELEEMVEAVLEDVPDAPAR